MAATAGVGQSLSNAWTQTWNGMADLAEAVDDLICSFDYSYADAAMDQLAMFIFFWIIFVLFTVFIIKWAYGKYKASKSKAAEPAAAIAKKVEATDAAPAPAIEAAPILADPLAKAKAGPLLSLPISKPPMAPKSMGGGVSATPPARKRLSRMSPGPEVQPTRKAGAAVPPSCVGADPVAARWASSLFQWLYSDLVVVNDLLQLWILAMNEYSKKSVEEHGVGIEFVRVLHESPVPKLSNVFCECDSKDDVTITCDCEATPALQLKAFRQKEEKVEVLHYRINVNRFRARLRVLCITEKLTGEFKCDGWPDVKVGLAAVGPLRSNPDEQQLQEMINDIVVSALRNTQVEFTLAHYPTCPRLRRLSETPSRLLPLHYDSMGSQNPLYTSTPTQNLEEQLLAGDKRLLVKVVSAQKLGGAASTEPKNAYCVVEMDEPAQRYQTSIKKDTNSPYWDEHFLFDLSPHTAELLFEIYDKGSSAHPIFLGLGIVGVEELLINPSQRQLISLQSRPLQDDPVTGILTVEFLFIEGADIPLTEGRPFKVKETLKTVSPTGQTLTTTRTMYKQNDVTMNGSAQIKESALKELERSPTMQANKSTLIIHSVQRTPKQLLKVEMTESGNFIEVEKTESEMDGIDGRNEDNCLEQIKENENSNGASPVESENGTENKANGNKVKEEQEKKYESQNGNSNLSQKEPGDHAMAPAETNGQPPERVPRQKKHKDFFGTIKKRLGRSRTRAKSVDIQDSGSEDQFNYRSVSADRQNNTVPSPSRMSMGKPSAPGSPAQSGDESRASRRSSISEMSAVSGASTRTYLHESSTLVLETTDNGVKKHFLVPLSIAQRSRWRRKGVKLHIFNDHTFVAKHLSGTLVCQVCNKNIARRIGKQGYECRDCLMKCHKHCHIRVIDNCPNSTIHTIELSMLPVLNE